MQRGALAVGLFALIACGAPAKPGAEPLRPPEAAPVAIHIPPAPAPVAVATASETTSAEPRTPDAGSPDPATPPPEPCAGATLNLDAILKQSACRATGRAAPPPAGLSVHTVPANLRVTTGGHLDFSLAFANTGKEALELDLEVGCGRFSLEAYDRAGKRADYINTTCGFMRGCGNALVHVSLQPGGMITKALGFDANVTKLDASCDDIPGGAMKPGTYELRIGTPLVSSAKSFDFREIKAKLIVAP